MSALRDFYVRVLASDLNLVTWIGVDQRRMTRIQCRKNNLVLEGRGGR
jgi:hypothetical protein